jgi:hypothetical protein
LWFKALKIGVNVKTMQKDKNMRDSWKEAIIQLCPANTREE